MNAPKRGQGNNQSAGSEQPNTPGPVVQPGEDPQAIAALAQTDTKGNPASGIENFLSEDAPGNPATSVMPDEAPAKSAPRGVPEAKEMSSAEMSDMLRQLAANQAQMASLISSMARNNPVIARGDKEQFSEVPLTTLDMPTEGSLDKMRRPDQRVEGVDIDVIANMDHAQQLAFLEEYVVINIAESPEEGAENPVVLHVNGRSVAIVRGEDTAVRRKYVELMLRAKPEGVKTRITRGADGEPRNHIDKTRSLKYPFSIVLDRNPRGPAWARKIRAEA